MFSIKAGLAAGATGPETGLQGTTWAQVLGAGRREVPWASSLELGGPRATWSLELPVRNLGGDRGVALGSWIRARAQPQDAELRRPIGNALSAWSPWEGTPGVGTRRKAPPLWHAHPNVCMLFLQQPNSSQLSLGPETLEGSRDLGSCSVAGGQR